MGIFTKGILGFSVALAAVSVTAQERQGILLSRTDFSITSQWGKSYTSFDEFLSESVYEGVLRPTIKAGADFSFAQGTASADGSSGKEAYSEFLEGMNYAVTDNPARLDTFRMADSTGFGGAIFALGAKSFSKNVELMTYTLEGLKLGSNYTIEVEYFNPLSSDYLDFNSALNRNSMKCGGPYLMSGYLSSLKIGTNNASADGVLIGTPGVKEMSSVKYQVSYDGKNNTSLVGVTRNGLTIHIYANQANAYEAIGIKSIKVYGDVDVKILGPSEVCAGGETAVLSVSRSFGNATYQWYQNGKEIAGATDRSYLYESGNSETGNTITAKITLVDSSVIETVPFVVRDVACCVGDNGEPMSKKLIWQDDFGTYTEKGKYWVWDYSDIYNPKKIEKTATDANGWADSLDYEIPGAKYWDGKIEDGLIEGYYTVAGNITCKWNDLSDGDGTQWGWPAMSFNGKKPGENGWAFVPDHTYQGEAWGAMLYLNCGNKPNEAIYTREITGLCETDITAKCFVNNFSDAKEPVMIQIRLTDLNDPSNVKTSAEIVRYSDGRYGIGWKEVSVHISLDQGASGAGVRMEIISKQGCTKGGDCEANLGGNDLVLDDIQIYACAAPRPKLSVEQEDILHNPNFTVYMSKAMVSYYRADARFVYQYTLTPDDNKSWVTINETPSQEYRYENDNFKYNASEGDTLYFRVICVRAGDPIDYIEEACADVAISDVVSFVYQRATGVQSVVSSANFSVANVTTGLEVSAESSCTVTIYSTDGVALWRGIVNGKKTVALAKGIYIVSNGNSSTKAVVK